MSIIFILLALVLLAALIPYGRDTRDLRDDVFDRENLWSRAPRA